MAIVEDFFIGNTHVLIDDECCVKTQEEVDAILKRCGEIYTQMLITKALEEQRKACKQDE